MIDTIHQKTAIRNKKKEASRFYLTSFLLPVVCILSILLLTSPAVSQEKQEAQNTVTIDFKEVELPVFIKFVSDVTGKSFVFDERIRGKVTINSPTPISTNDLYDVFLSILDFKGFTALPDGKVTRIVPSQEAKQRSGNIVTDSSKIIREGFITRLIPLQFLNVSDAQRILTPLISKNGAISFNAMTNTLVITDSPFNISKLVSLISELDKEPLFGEGGIHVYYLKNADAEEIAKVLNELFGKIKPTRQTARTPKGAATARPVATSGNQVSGPISVTADKNINALIIKALPEDFEAVKSVIEKLDIRRRQVFVEAAIMEITLSRLQELGFEFRSVESFDGSNVTAAGGTNFGGMSTAITGPAGLSTLSGLAVGVLKGTISFGGTDFLNIGALLRALQSETGVNILSTPQILTTDNQKAEIVVGENVPIITGQNISTGGNIQTSIERQDIGVTLRITPHINAGDFIKLDIYAEISSLSESVFFDPNEVGPLLNKRFAETSVVVKDKETIIIAGLIKDNKTTKIQKVPVLGDIPLLGLLFRYKKEQIDKTNLLIFITPTIIKEASTLEAIKRKKEKEMEDIRKQSE
ncbi:MAG: type II secretion system secretin GspD [Thermodesulfobacteriota bacterium]